MASLLFFITFVTDTCGFKHSYRPIRFKTPVSALPPTETVNVTTRDGITLETNIYLPNIVPQPYRTIYEKTPYGKDGLAGDAQYFVEMGYAFIGQDCRGRYNSTGNYSFWRTSGNDTIDTLIWLTQQEWSNDLVGVYGVSADAIAQYTDFSGITYYYNENNSSYYNSILNNIKIASLVVGNSIFRQTTFQNGAYRQGLVSGWLKGINEDNYINTVLEHEIFDTTNSITGDLYWEPVAGQYRNQWNIFNFPSIHLAGFYDIFSTNQIRTVIALNQSTNSSAKGQQILMIDPGGHCAQGAIDWPNQTYIISLALDNIMPKVFAAAFECAKNNKAFDIHQYVDFNVIFYMLGPGNNTGSKHVEDGNYYVQGESLPDTVDQYFYLSDGNMLTNNKQTTDNNVSFIYNPNNPVPTYGGNNLILEPCGPQDQSKIERNRKDILHFTSPVLTEKIALVGLISVELYVSSNVTDTDFSAKLIDIFPDGKTHMLVQQGIIRMRWRDGLYSNIASQMKNNEIYNITIEIGIMSYIINPDHQISISISSSNYPFFSQNWNSDKMVIDGNEGYQIANNTIHFGGVYPSRLILPTVNMQWIEERKV